MSLADTQTDHGAPPPVPISNDLETGDNNTGLPSFQPIDDDPQVREVLASEVGIATMLGRLKQSIASAKDFALFLKRRAALEEEHAQGIKKMCRHSQESVQKGEHRGGSFAKAYDDMMIIHERMSENGVQFGSSLMQMNEDLLELAAMSEKSRKGWKQSGLAAEQRVLDLETAMRKSKHKYDSLAEEYERVRTGDTSGGKSGKVFGIRGPKSAEQHEQDLLRKVQTADQDYHARVQTYQAERSELLNKTRPETVKALVDLVRECDSAVVLQMQKFATFNEKLLLSNGLCVSPLKGQEGDSRSFRDCIAAIDNDRDLKEYVSNYHRNLPPKTPEPKYERNPVLDSQPRGAISPTGPPGQSTFQSMAGSTSQPASVNNRASVSGFADSPMSPPGQGPMGHGYQPSTNSMSMGPSSQRSGSQPFQPDHGRSFSISSLTSRGLGGFGRTDHPPPQQQQFVHRGQGSQQPPPNQNPRFNGPPSGPPNSYGPSGSQSAGAGGPPQLGALPFQPSSQPTPPQHQLASPLPPPPTRQQQPQSSYSPSYGPPGHPDYSSPPGSGYQQAGMGQHIGRDANQAARNGQQQMQAPQQPSPVELEPLRQPVFGVTLQELYDRDQLPVPMVVVQCIQAVDLYGLEVEGIYRLSGSLPSINKLKAMFNHDSKSPDLDFRNPENFMQDVNSVAGLLKQFFRDLPDPLLTRQYYQEFIDAAKTIQDDVKRRDALHAIINNLPDPNYATLRSLTLHLHRVMEKSAINRMTAQNLAIVFGPTLMGTDSNLADSGFQSKVVETILLNTYQIFDDD